MVIQGMHKILRKSCTFNKHAWGLAACPFTIYTCTHKSIKALRDISAQGLRP